MHSLTSLGGENKRADKAKTSWPLGLIASGEAGDVLTHDCVCSREVVEVVGRVKTGKQTCNACDLYHTICGSLENVI